MGTQGILNSQNNPVKSSYFSITKLYYKVIVIKTVAIRQTNRIKNPETDSCMHSAVVQLLTVSNYLRPHGLQHARLPCPSLSPGVCSNSCSLSWWCHPTISSSVAPFSSCLQSFPASGSFPSSWLFTSGGQSIGASASGSVLPLNIQGWFPVGLTGLIYMLFKSRDFWWRW